ncbi:M3 family metallopeptidase [Carboxylicivirga sp. N1Y90]|uniref:M3 family metallopeptidase n=1 Tax=Carboxylicivirga fragile TaxID=3417571 RepID=UPI003D3429E7|nr:M3 family metallopeptidase [Marinilabiliaceae bacterium N1Y90]
MINPLLETFNTTHQVPPFNEIKEEHYLPAFKQLIKDAKHGIEDIANSNEQESFENTIEAMEMVGKQLNVVSHVFFNLNHAETNEEIQGIAREVSPLLTEYSNDIWLNPKLFARVKAVNDHFDEGAYSKEQIKLLQDTYKAFVRKGALLKGDAQVRYREITNKLAKLSLKFGENLLAETNDYNLHIIDEAQLSGLPQGLKDAAAEVAKGMDKEGWVFTLQFPSYVPFMKYASDRTLRKEMFMAYSNRGNNANKHDNNDIIKQLVSLRYEKAQLLGYNTHADYVLEEHMAVDPKTVNAFLNELLEASIGFGRSDVKAVEEFAQSLGFEGPLQRWDYPYYSEQLKADKYGLDDEATRPYFELEKVETGIFSLATGLYGLSFKPNNSAPVYHDEVRVYDVYDGDGQFLSVFYVDYFPRNTKQGGAWMTSFREQYKTSKEDVRPHVSIVCNFTRPVGDKPSLLTFNEVKTFLHEFGHALHGMLSKVSYESLSGTNVYRDFVELPSQIMENWATQKQWLQDVGVHYKTGELIPDEMINSIIESDNYQSGYATVRQLSFGLNDMAWHSLDKTFNGEVCDFEKQAMSATELFPEVEGTVFSTGFSHIFDGGYAAGYYGYKWAEVLDADAFDSFLGKGIYDKETAKRFRESILEKGGTEHPMELYKRFKGQEPSIEPLLKRSGLKK